MMLRFPEKEKLAEGEVFIFDLGKVSTKYLTMLSIASIRCFFKYILEAHPIRIKQVHMVNASSIVSKGIIIAKPFLGSRTTERTHFHLPNSTTLFDFVPRELLPVEFGGTLECFQATKLYWIDKAEKEK